MYFWPIMVISGSMCCITVVFYDQPNSVYDNFDNYCKRVQGVTYDIG